MAIQMRRGQKADFDPSKMLPGEWAVSIDSDTTKQWVWMCFAPGVVKRIATFEDIEWVLSDEFAKSSVICDVELDSTATKAYAVGDFLMLHGHLYQVTAAIAIGDTITEGTNVSETTVMATIDGKVDKEAGKGLSTEDYTSAEKTKLGDLPTATDLQTALSGKVDKVTGKGLSTEDYTTAEKTKLGALPDAATLNADLASKADDAEVVKSVNNILPTNGAVEVTAEDIPADGIGDKSVSGNPIVIEDGMASVAKELSVTLEPIQDLHGYESPWIGTDTDKAPYLFRAISESSVQDKGTHELDKLIGGTVAFNQILKELNGTNYTVSSATVSFSDGACTLTATEQYGMLFCDITDGIKASHKYVISADIALTSSTNSVFVQVRRSGANVASVGTASTTSRQIVATVFYTDTTSTAQFRIIDTRASGLDAITIRNVQLFDLTQMFGSTIADYIYSLEQATAGAGVSWFRRLFPAPYYAYDSGTLMSVKTSVHVTRGFNQWDEEWELGSLNVTTGQSEPSTSNIRAKNYIKVVGGNSYYFNTAGARMYFFSYDENFNVIGSRDSALNEIKNVPTNTMYIRFNMAGAYGTTYNNDICINLSKTTGTPKNGDYVAYEEHSYPLDSDLELRGIPKLDSNNKLYYDGDIYEASGNVQRRYGVVDLGTLTWGYYDDLYFRAEVPGMKAVADFREGYNLLTPNYALTRDSITTAPDKTIRYRGSNLNGVLIKDSAYGSDATAFKTAMSGVYLVYELATPTTETADPYTSMQVIDTSGTEEYVDSRTVAIPVGHESNYANICPIEGRTGTEVQRTGKNLFDKDNANVLNAYIENSIVSANGQRTIYIPCKPNTTYTAQKIAVAPTAGDRFALGYTHTTPAVGETVYGRVRKQSSFVIGDKIDLSLTTDADAKFLVLWISQSEGYDASIPTTMIEEGSSATSYEPYSKDTASVTFGQTVYGCTHDFVSGKCRVTHGYVVLDGSENWTQASAQGFYTQANSVRKLSSYLSAIKCDKLATIVNHSYLVDLDYGISGYYDAQSQYENRNWIYAKVAGMSTSADFKAWLALNPLQVTYELAEPIELDLTPAQLTLLEGTNILTADGTINLTYLGSMASNVQAEIDEFENGLNNVIGSIAFIENSTAKTSHAIGEYIIMNGIFCKVIAAISSGETLSFGTNIRATTIGAELRAIWAEISA